MLPDARREEVVQCTYLAWDSSTRYTTNPPFLVEPHTFVISDFAAGGIIRCRQDKNVRLTKKMTEFSSVTIGVHQDHGDVQDSMFSVVKFHLEVCEQPGPPS